jgi:signal transduction histidine kinase
MDSENYEDTVDVLDMLRGNLQKVSQHGQNTTRALKAMEEMLKDRSGGIVPMSLTSVLKQDFDMLNAYYADDIKQYGIKTILDIPENEISINGNATQLSKMVMSILANAVYAVIKKAKREKPDAYTPEISLKAAIGDNSVSITVRDNGIGIEDTIKEKIFDPFFTTKTTGEASGVGLYLSREIVQNHGGDIHMNSVKDNYSEFTITLPI